jgi:hypothetical protein
VPVLLVAAEPTAVAGWETAEAAADVMWVTAEVTGALARDTAEATDEAAEAAEPVEEPVEPAPERAGAGEVAGDDGWLAAVAVEEPVGRAPEAAEAGEDEGLALDAVDAAAGVAADAPWVTPDVTWEAADVMPFRVLVTAPVTAPSRPPDEAGVVEVAAVRLTVAA